MAKNIYVGVNNIARKSNKIYTGVNNVSRKVTEGYIGIGGLARQFYPSGIALSTLALGARVLYGGKYYTVIAKSYCVPGDVILWSETSDKKSMGGFFNVTVNTTPFGTGNTNNVTVNYSYDEGDTTITKSATGYGWRIPARALGFSTSYGSPKMSYFASTTERIRSTEYNCPDTEYYSETATSYIYVTSVGRITTTRTSKSRDIYYAYSVKGTLLCTQNSDGTYTLQI